MTATLCQSAAVMVKAGVDAHANALTEAQWTQIIDEAQGFLCGQAKYDFVSNWGTISGMCAAPMVSDACASLAAVSLINHDLNGYATTTKGQTALNVNYAKVQEIVNLLRDSKFLEFVKTGVES